MKQPPYGIHKSPHTRSIQVELGKVEGFWNTLKTSTVSTSHIFECWATSSLATDSGENQSAVPCDNDVIKSVWVRPIGLRHLEFLGRTLYLVLVCLIVMNQNWYPVSTIAIAISCILGHSCATTNSLKQLCKPLQCFLWRTLITNVRKCIWMFKLKYMT